MAFFGISLEPCCKMLSCKIGGSRLTFPSSCWSMSIRSFLIWCGSHILSYPNCFTGLLGHQQCLPYYMETAYTVKVSPNFRWLIDQLNKPKSRKLLAALVADLLADLPDTTKTRKRPSDNILHLPKEMRTSPLSSHITLQKKLNHHHAYFTSSFLHTVFCLRFEKAHHMSYIHFKAQRRHQAWTLFHPYQSKESQAPRQEIRISAQLWIVYD